MWRYSKCLDLYLLPLPQRSGCYRLAAYRPRQGYRSRRRHVRRQQVRVIPSKILLSYSCETGAGYVANSAGLMAALIQRNTLNYVFSNRLSK